MDPKSLKAVLQKKNIKLLNQIEKEKCDSEIVLTSNLRLRKCHNFVSKNRPRHICDGKSQEKFCLKSYRLISVLDIIGCEKYGCEVIATKNCDKQCVLCIIKPKNVN